MTRFFPFFNEFSGRWEIDGVEIHCGDCFQVRKIERSGSASQWYDVRAEYDHDCGGGYWYLVGLPNGWNRRCWDIYEAKRYE